MYSISRGVAVYEETVTVAELFEEELEALIAQHERLITENTSHSLEVANSLEHVIKYFRVRLGHTDDDLESVYGAGPEETLH